MHKDGLGTTLQNVHQVVFGNFRLTLHDHLIALDRNHFARIFIDKVLVPTLQHTCSQLAANGFLQSSLVDLYFLREVENLQDVLIILETDGTEQCSNRQLLLTVDVSVHHIINIRGKLYP